MGLVRFCHRAAGRARRRLSSAVSSPQLPLAHRGLQKQTRSPPCPRHFCLALLCAPRSGNQAGGQPAPQRWAGHQLREGWGAPSRGTQPARRPRGCASRRQAAPRAPDGRIHARRRRGGHRRQITRARGGEGAAPRAGAPFRAAGWAAPGRPLGAGGPGKPGPLPCSPSGEARWSVPGGAERGPSLFLSRWFRSERLRCRCSPPVPVSAPGRSGVFSLP